MYILFFISSVIVFFGGRRVYGRIFMYRLLNHSETLYIDDGTNKLLVDREFGVTSKPDRVVRFCGKVYLLEFKSRKSGVYDKDIIQACVGGLAYWGAVSPVNFILVYNGSYAFKKLRVKSKQRLFKKCSKYILMAKKIKSGKSVRTRVVGSKCRVCPYRESCKKSKN